MNNIIKLVVTAMIAVYCMGCTSTWSYKASENEMYRQRIMATGDQSAIDALNLGIPPRRAIEAISDPGTFGLAINLNALDVLSYHPWRQLGCAILDAGTAYAAYYAVTELGSDGDSSSVSTSTDTDSRDTNVNVSNSDNTSITITGDSTSYTTTTSTEIGDGNSSSGD